MSPTLICDLRISSVRTSLLELRAITILSRRCAQIKGRILGRRDRNVRSGNRFPSQSRDRGGAIEWVAATEPDERQEHGRFRAGITGRRAPKLTVTRAGKKSRVVASKPVLPVPVRFGNVILDFFVAQAALDPVKWGASRAQARPHLTVSSVKKFGPPNLFKRPDQARPHTAPGSICGFCLAGRESLLTGA